MTAAAPLFSDPYRPAFAEFVANRREPDAIARLRREAFDRFEALGWPTRQQEAWRLTDLSALQTLALQPPADALVDAGTLPTLDGPTHRLVFVNGRFAPGLSHVRELPDRVLIASLGQALLTHSQLIESRLDCLPGLNSTRSPP
jgi:Fe-S cluster assembly protein SufD